MYRCYLLDDEQHAIDALRSMLQKKFSGAVQVCGSSSRVAVALDEIQALKPDILFLDVVMPEMSGLEVLRHFPNRSFQVIFTTAHDKYALPALKAGVVDYLLKPLSPQDVYEALEKCFGRLAVHESRGTDKRLTLHTLQEMLVVSPDDIIRIEAANNYSVFHFINRPKVVVSKTLKEFEDQLSSSSFFRVHQSHLINLKHVLSVNSHEGDTVLLAQAHRVEISRRKKQEFLLRLRQL